MNDVAGIQARAFGRNGNNWSKNSQPKELYQNRAAKKLSLHGENRKAERSPITRIRNTFELTCNDPAASLIKKSTNARHYFCRSTLQRPS
jgi:hypothetical protein